MFKNIFRSRHTLWSMSLAQLKSRYAGSVLGIFWAVINPLLIMLAISFVFTRVFKTEIVNFSFFVLSGLMPWMFFSNALSEATGSILSQQNLIRQYSFPSAILPLSSVLSNFLNFIIGWVVIYPFFLYFNPKIIMVVPWLTVILFLNLCLACGLGLALSILNVFVRDIGHLLGVVLMLWFWLTPVFYRIEMIPAHFLWLYDINPLTPYMVCYQKVIFEGTAPSVSIFIQTLMWALGILLAGSAVFIRLEPRLSKKF